jgi:DNA-directed RNA polymerase subunit RPC12/RpoP
METSLLLDGVPLQDLVARVEGARSSRKTLSPNFTTPPAAGPSREGARARPSRPASAERKMECPTCGHRWLDRHAKDECPKCLSSLSKNYALRAGGGAKRAPGEVSTFKEKPGSAMESRWGVCKLGGAHSWRFGRCSKCGENEGSQHYREAAASAECERGGRHVFSFTNRCSKCGKHVFRHVGEVAQRAAEAMVVARGGTPLSESRGRSSSSPALRQPRRPASASPVWPGMTVTVAATPSSPALISGSYSPGGASGAVAYSPIGPPRGSPPERSPPKHHHHHHQSPSADACTQTLPYHSASDAWLLQQWEMHGAVARGALAVATARLDPQMRAQRAEEAALRAERNAAMSASRASAPALSLERSRWHIKSSDIGLSGLRGRNNASVATHAGGEMIENDTHGYKERTRECPSCGHRWLDKWRKDECPKCLKELSTPDWRRARRLPGEVSTYKEPPGSAMESEYGVCKRGGAHSWRFGRCSKCGMPEGTALYEMQRQERSDGRVAHDDPRWFEASRGGHPYEL